MNLNGNDGRIVMSWYYKEVRKNFVVTNIYGVQPFGVMGVLQSVTIKTLNSSQNLRIL